MHVFVDLISFPVVEIWFMICLNSYIYLHPCISVFCIVEVCTLWLIRLQRRNRRNGLVAQIAIKDRLLPSRDVDVGQIKSHI